MNVTPKTAIEIVIVVFQTILLIFGWQIRDSVVDHEKRLDALEKVASSENLLTRGHMAAHEALINTELRDLWIAIGENRSAAAYNLERINSHHPSR